MALTQLADKSRDACLAATVLVVDDRADERMLVRTIVERMGHRVVEAGNGQEALALALARAPDLILSDMLMPIMDGFEFCRRLQEHAVLRHVPFVFVTATYGEQHDREFAADLGAARVLLKPFEAQVLRAIVAEILDEGDRVGATQCFERLDEREFHQRHAGVVNRKLEEKVEELEAANARLRASDTRTRQMFDAVVATISKMVECRDPYTIGHERRVGDLAASIGQALGLDDDRLEGLRIGGHLHDVGKIALPSEILNKPGRLSQIEQTLLRSHAQTGYEILCSIDFPWQVAEMAWQHHERLDGSGYPRGLQGDQILLEARILAVADVVEAMVSHRPYRPAVGLDRALEELSAGRGTRYEPAVVDACRGLFLHERFSFG